MASAPNYTISDLGTFPGGSQSAAYGINAQGWAVGTASTATGDFHAFLYEGAALQDLGTLGGGSSTATGVNAAGQVVGQAETLAGEVHAFITSSMGLQDLSTFGGKSSVLNRFATGPGNPGDLAAGSAETGDGAVHALLYANGARQEVANSSGGRNIFATAISSTGMLVGGAENDALATHAFVAGFASFKDLGTLGGRTSSATGVNASGQVIGNSDLLGGAIHAFLWPGSGPLLDLQTLGGRHCFARAINSGGLIVGKSSTQGDEMHAFLYNGTLIDLNSLIPAATGWELIEATDMNDAGLIVGYGRVQGRIRAFLLTPDHN